MYIWISKHRTAHSLIWICLSLLFMHSLTEIGGPTEPQWNGRIILSNAWCPVIVFPAKKYQFTSVWVGRVVWNGGFINTNQSRAYSCYFKYILLEQSQKCLDLWQRWTMLCIFESIDIKNIVIGYFGKTFCIIGCEHAATLGCEGCILNTQQSSGS